jgi:hypothetical protein
MLPQDGVQGQLILTNERLGAVVLVPILAKSKNFRDGYSKRDRLSVKMLIVLGMSSSYSLDANASRGRARIFHAFTPKPRQRTGLIAGSDTNCQPLLRGSMQLASQHVASPRAGLREYDADLTLCF